jgi:hypothetical protein
MMQSRSLSEQSYSSAPSQLSSAFFESHSAQLSKIFPKQRLAQLYYFFSKFAIPADINFLKTDFVLIPHQLRNLLCLETLQSFRGFRVLVSILRAEVPSRERLRHLQFLAAAHNVI